MKDIYTFVCETRGRGRGHDKSIVIKV